MEICRFPNKLRSYRRCQGWSQKKVARMLGLADTSTLSRWERGYALPGTLNIFRLARMYHTFPQLLFDDLWVKCITEDDLLTQAESFNTNQSLYV